MSNDYSLSDIQKALNEKKAKQSEQRQNLVESMAEQMPVKHLSESDKKHQVTEQRLTALANRVENLMGMSSRISMVEQTANTLVSGIGHNANGASQGSGIVKVADADDMFIDSISHGESIMWDQTLLSFIPGAGGGGGGAGTLNETLFLGNKANKDIEFENTSGVVYNTDSILDEFGHNTWRTATDTQGGIIKRETFNNSLDSAKVVNIDTKYDKDNGKGVYIESGGDVSLHDFNSKNVDWQDATLGKRIVNVDVLNNRLEAERAILIEKAVQMLNFNDAKDINASIFTGNQTQFSLMNKFGIHNTGVDGLPITPTPLERYPKGSYLLLERDGTSDYGLFEIVDDGVSRPPATEFNSITFLDGQGELNAGEQVNVYAFNKNYDLTLLQLLLHEIEARVAKDGDAMSGGLEINVQDKTKNPISFEIKGLQSSGGGSNYVFSAHLDSKDRDIVEYHGPMEDGDEIVNKKYVDNLIQSIAGGLNYIGEVDPDTDDLSTIDQSPSPGDFYIFDKDGTWIPTGEAVKSGDWLLYDGVDWNILSRDLSGDYLALTGGTMAGPITMGPGHSIFMNSDTPVVTRRIDSGNNSNLEIFRNGDRKVQVADGSVQVFEDFQISGSGNLKVRNGCQIISGGNNIINLFGNGARYLGNIIEDTSFVNKKYVDDEISSAVVTGDYVPLDGSKPMTGNLKIHNVTNSNSEAGITLTGDRPNATNAAGTIKFINLTAGTGDAAVGYLTYRADSSNKFFRFSKSLEVKGNLTAETLQVNDDATFDKDITSTGLVTGADLYISSYGDRSLKVSNYMLEPFKVKYGATSLIDMIPALVNVNTKVQVKGGFGVNDNSLQPFFQINMKGRKMLEYDGNGLSYEGSMTKDNQLVTKKFVEDYVGGNGGGGGGLTEADVRRIVQEMSDNGDIQATTGAAVVDILPNNPQRGQIYIQADGQVAFGL